MNRCYKYLKVLLLLSLGIFSEAKSNVAVPIDAGISAILSPSVGACYGPSQSVIVTIKNFGTNVISGIPVTVMMWGPSTQSISAVYSGSIALGGTANFNVGNVNMGLGGVYTFSAYTSMAGDGEPSNDFAVTSRTVSPFVNINGPNLICMGGSATLTAAGANSYTWNNMSNATSIAVSPTVSTVYSVVGTNTSGCTAIALFTLSVQNPTLTTNNDFSCGIPASGILTANAFSPSVVRWYASPTSTNVLGTGNAFAVSSSSTVTYYAEAQSTSSNTLFTTLAGGNAFTGNMFDVQAINTVTIDALDCHFNSTNTSTVEVWYRPGTFVGFENSNAGWTMALSSVVNPLGTGSLTPIPGTFAIEVPAGQTFGIYVTTNGGSQVNYTNGSALGNLYASTSDLQFHEGKGGGYFSVNSSPRIFNGVLKYKKEGCTSPRVPATFTAITGVTVTATTNATAVCEGSGTTFTANGAMNYTWSPAGDISPSPNATIVTATPTANTTYTLFGSIPTCTQIGTYTVQLTTKPAPTLSITPSQTVLPGTILSLTTAGAFTYSWSPGGSNNTTILVSPTVTTVYTVLGTSMFGCSSTISTTVTIGSVGLKKHERDQIEVLIFPNPSNGQVTILAEVFDESYIFELYDVSGKIIRQQTIDGKETILNFSELLSGFYQYKIRSTRSGETVNAGKLLKD
jgi:hypothetical protein